MENILFDIEDDSILTFVAEILALDDKNNFKTSYPENFIDIIYKKYIPDNKIIVHYYYNL